jgi:multicomponent Na+:H+ antiporter subunit E
MARILHAIKYLIWLWFQIILASWTVLIDVATGSRKVDPCVVFYPLRVTKPWQITVFSASVTMTPGTLSLAVVDKEGVEITDEDENQTPHFLAVQAVHGSDPRGVLDDLAHMEQTMAPEVKDVDQDLDTAPVLYPAPAPTLADEHMKKEA